MFHRRTVVSLTLGAACLWAAPILAQSVTRPTTATTPTPPGSSMTVPTGTLVPPGKTPDLTIFFTGDVVGYLDPCG